MGHSEIAIQREATASVLRKTKFWIAISCLKSDKLGNSSLFFIIDLLGILQNLGFYLKTSVMKTNRRTNFLKNI